MSFGVEDAVHLALDVGGEAHAAASVSVGISAVPRLSSPQ